jgi:hypothetical protein
VVWLALAGGFAAFMVLVGAVHALDRHAAGRFGYRPFALPNLALMLVPHGLAAAALAGPLLGADPGTVLPLGEVGVWALGGLGLAAAGVVLWAVRRRTDWPIALVSTLAMLLAAPVLILSVLAGNLAESGRGDGPEPRR